MTVARLVLSRLLAWRSVTYRPWRALFLCGGFGLGVGVMITLLAVGEAMVSQASQEKLVGGGEITVLPEGIDIEVLTTGGLGGLFFSVPNARFVYQQVLTSPRMGGALHTVAPQLEGKLLYVSLADGTQQAVRASGEIPSATRALGAMPRALAGRWDDDNGDRRWIAPTLAELRHDIDHFHLPPPELADRRSWGEWHYFNVLSRDATQWAFISFIVGGDVRGSEWGGQLLVTLHERGRSPRRFSALVPREGVRFSTRDADLRVGDGSVRVRQDGAYIVHSAVREDGTGVPLVLDLVVQPAPRAYFPGATLVSGDFASGYAVAGLRASASGTVCVAARCTAYDSVQAYHDHNWGSWSGVTWEWGATRAGAFTLLYGRVNPPSDGADSPLFVYVTDSTGFVALFRPSRIEYTDGRTVVTTDGRLRMPSVARLIDVRGADTLDLLIAIDDAVATDTRLAGAERGESGPSRELARPWFVQMAGTATLRGRVRGNALMGEGRGFFETYR
ncbi:MAG TPA: hypothetical protein VE869_00880 [Gemmatimonas sp.]|nr:hypothetical protein [Gemmatimonas sp.]